MKQQLLTHVVEGEEVRKVLGGVGDGGGAEDELGDGQGYGRRADAGVVVACMCIGDEGGGGLLL